jgi:hypothetical protein
LTLYQWSCFVTGSLYNWTGVGALGYLILFQASTWFTELITKKKYPEYQEYIGRVGKFTPKLSGSLPGDFSDKKAKPKVEREANGDVAKSAAAPPKTGKAKKSTKN